MLVLFNTVEQKSTMYLCDVLIEDSLDIRIQTSAFDDHKRYYTWRSY